METGTRKQPQRLIGFHCFLSVCVFVFALFFYSFICWKNVLIFLPSEDPNQKIIIHLKNLFKSCFYIIFLDRNPSTWTDLHVKALNLLLFL